VDNVDEGIAKSAHCINWFSDFFMANWQRFSVRENKKSGTGISNPGPVDRRQRIIEVLQFRGEGGKGRKGMQDRIAACHMFVAKMQPC